MKKKLNQFKCKSYSKGKEVEQRDFINLFVYFVLSLFLVFFIFLRWGLTAGLELLTEFPDFISGVPELHHTTSLAYFLIAGSGFFTGYKDKGPHLDKVDGSCTNDSSRQTNRPGHCYGSTQTSGTLWSFMCSLAAKCT